jgi:hypothetical protein
MEGLIKELRRLTVNHTEDRASYIVDQSQDVSLVWEGCILLPAGTKLPERKPSHYERRTAASRVIRVSNDCDFQVEHRCR